MFQLSERPAFRSKRKLSKFTLEAICSPTKYITTIHDKSSKTTHYILYNTHLPHNHISPPPEFPHSTVSPVSRPWLSAAAAGGRCGLSSPCEEPGSDTCAARMARGKTATRGRGAGWGEGGTQGRPAEGSRGSGRSWSSPPSARWTGRSELSRGSPAETRSWTDLKSRESRRLNEKRDRTASLDGVCTWYRSAWCSTGYTQLTEHLMWYPFPYGYKCRP